MKKCKFLAISLLIIILFNIFFSLIYYVTAEENKIEENVKIENEEKALKDDEEIEEIKYDKNEKENNTIIDNNIEKEDDIDEDKIVEENDEKIKNEIEIIEENIDQNKKEDDKNIKDEIDVDITNKIEEKNNINEKNEEKEINTSIESEIKDSKIIETNVETKQTLEIEESKVESVENLGETVAEPSIEYQAHVQDIGWQAIKRDGEMAGTSGKSKRVEAIKINLKGVNSNAKISYQTHIQDIGWQKWKGNGELSGTEGKAKRIEAIRIKLENLTGYSVEYRVHIQDYGWQKWKKNGELAGSEGQSKRIESIQIRIVKTGEEKNDISLNYQTHVQDIGWQAKIEEGFVAGTSGQSKRIEAIKINLENPTAGAKIQYRTHIQDIGWQAWKSNGELSGTEGKAKRIEAIQIKLQGISNYTIEYQVNIQDYGWSAWYIDGETAGTVGKEKRIEAIRIRFAPKYYRNYKGIDVSQWQGEINWNKVKASGVQFAIIRIGYRGYRYGTLVEDAQFLNNVKGAKNVGIPIGVYFFSQAVNTTEGAEEATWVINKLKEYNNISIQYPIVIDTEDSGARGAGYDPGRADLIDKRTRTNAVVGFCNKVRSSGYTPMIYASRDWFYDNLEYGYLTSYDIWLAHYTGSPSVKSNFKYGYQIWQYSSSGSVSGINGDVDMNVAYKKY